MTDIYQKLGIPRREESHAILRDMQVERDVLIHNASQLIAEFVINFECGIAQTRSADVHAERLEGYLSELIKNWTDEAIKTDNFPARRCEYFAGLSMFIESLNRIGRTDHDEAVAEEAKIMLTIIKMWREWELI